MQPVWQVRRVAFEDLGDTAEPGVAQVVPDRRKQAERRLPVAVEPVARLGVRAQQPAPDRTLVVGAVAVDLVAAVGAPIGRIVRRKRAQTVARSATHDRPRRARPGLGSLEQRIGERQRKDLVRPHRPVVAVRSVDHVGEMVEVRRRKPRGTSSRTSGRPGHRTLSRRSASPRSAGSAPTVRSTLYQSALISTGLPIRGVTTQSPTLASIQVSCTPAPRPAAGRRPDRRRCRSACQRGDAR